MFGRKTAQIRDLEKSIESMRGWREDDKKKIAALEASELKLMGQIREMDQLIFRMSQCTDWSTMRPIFNELQAPVERRMRLESDRIKSLLIPEMQKAYR